MNAVLLTESIGNGVFPLADVMNDVFHVRQKVCTHSSAILFAKRSMLPKPASALAGSKLPMLIVVEAKDLVNVVSSFCPPLTKKAS